MLRPDISRLKKNRGIFLKIGFLCALLFVNYAFRLEIAPPDYDSHYVVSSETIEVVEIPRTIEKKPKVLPPPPIEDIIEPEPDVETPEYVEELIPENIPTQEVDEPRVVDLDDFSIPVPDFKMPEAENEVVTDIEIDNTVYEFVEEMPRFPGCEEMALEKNEKRKCAEKAMLEFVYSKLKYPEMAIQNNIEGTVVVSFVIGKDGKPKDFEVMRDPHQVLGNETIRVLKLMPDWIPGKQRFRPVAVKYKLPIKFNLQR